jgi:hypothetical protein
MSEVIPVFDSSRNFEVTLSAEDGQRPVVVRFPSDQEWKDYQREIRVITRSLGGGRSQTDVPDSEEAALALFTKIEIGGPVVIEPYEAEQVIDIIGRARVDSVERIPGGFRVGLEVPGGLVIHESVHPTAKQLQRFDRHYAQQTQLPHNRTETIVNLAIAEELYDKIQTSATGYAGAVPVNHKSAVVDAVVKAIRLAVSVKAVADPLPVSSGPPTPVCAT